MNRSHLIVGSLIAGFAGMLVATGVAQAAGISRAAMLANSCAACHGPDGRGAKKIPKLKGLDAKDIIETMKGFQTGEEKSTVMDRHAKGYTDQEIKLMANYFAKFKKKK
jgi:sulfide dehydrogenase cytochrome subunit